ncbi:MAG: transglycosylase SLT domain-containing protein, partial [Deltaproteobacteria bacterium]|nr:transglycosylase SLT domain-containing protein [Deltaproteobacteria bacterium]
GTSTMAHSWNQGSQELQHAGKSHHILDRLGPGAGLWALLMLGIAIGSIRLGRELWQLVREIRRAQLVRRVGRVSILAGDGLGVPYSCWLPFRAYVVLPAFMLGSRDDTGIAIRHELQHHRQGDTLWVFAMAALKITCFWNPAAHAWARLFTGIQEFTCDEILIGRRKVLPRAYGRCLLRVAELAVGSRRQLVGTTGMAAGASGSFLRRRIEMILNQKRKSWQFVQFSLGLGTVALLAATSFVVRASETGSFDRSFTMAEARNMAAAAASGSQIPITVNDLVLVELNRYVGTPGGRASLREALTRMPQYKAMIEGKIAEYGMPAELLSVPVHESRYENATWTPGAGLWGFIAQTARHYDLVVNDHVDERLDEVKETGAAMRYFRDLYNIFHDWRLALKAYNEGENKVVSLIKKYGTRDPWELEHLAQSKEHYLAGVTAIIILMKNPTVLD